MGPCDLKSPEFRRRGACGIGAVRIPLSPRFDMPEPLCMGAQALKTRQNWKKRKKWSAIIIPFLPLPTPAEVSARETSLLSVSNPPTRTPSKIFLPQSGQPPQPQERGSPQHHPCQAAPTQWIPCTTVTKRSDLSHPDSQNPSWPSPRLPSTQPLLTTSTSDPAGKQPPATPGFQNARPTSRLLHLKTTLTTTPLPHINRKYVMQHQTRHSFYPCPSLDMSSSVRTTPFADRTTPSRKTPTMRAMLLSETLGYPCGLPQPNSYQSRLLPQW